MVGKNIWTKMAMNCESCTDTLLRGKELLESEIDALSDFLHSRTVPELRSIASRVDASLQS